MRTSLLLFCSLAGAAAAINPHTAVIPSLSSSSNEQPAYKFSSPLLPTSSSSSSSSPTSTSTSTNSLSISGGQTAPSSTKGVVPAILAAAFCTATIMYPVDLVRALKMANAGSGQSTSALLSNFKATHGVSGFFTQGLAPEVARATWMRFLKFGLFPFIHQGMYTLPVSKGSPMTKAFAAAVTSVPEVLTIMPLEIAKVQLQLDSAKVLGNSMVTAMSSVWKSHGASGFLVGWTGIQYRQAAWSAAYFASLSTFEEQIAKGTAKIGLKSDTFNRITSGFCAGVFGACLNTPGDTVRTVVQKRIFNNQLEKGVATTFLGVGREIVSQKGATALYSGFGFKALHLGGGGALMALFVPTFKKVFGATE